MNCGDAPTWSPQGGPEEDFSSFLDFPDLQVNFSTFEDGPDSVGGGNQVTMEEYVNAANAMHDATMPHAMDLVQTHTPASTVHGSGDSLVELNIQAQLYQQRLQRQQQQHQIHQQGQAAAQHAMQQHYQHQYPISPTPNSFDMHGTSGPRFPDPRTLGMYNANGKHGQAAFTPLVSPAYQMQDFARPGEYFSPLTSPALQAQDGAAERAVYGSGRSDNSNASSLEPDPGQAAPEPQPKKARRQPNSSAKDPVRPVKASLAMKAQQKKLSGARTPKEMAEIMEGVAALQQGSPRTKGGRSSVLRNKGNSESGSISPETLSEALMPPPAVPRSTGSSRSPHIRAQDAQHADRSSGNAPATPASLMRIQKSGHEATLTNDITVKQDALQRSQFEVTVDNSTSRTSLPALDTQMVNAPSSGGKKFSLSAPATSVISPVATVSPAMTSTTSASAIPRSDGNQLARHNKKRSSSSHVSPALRPRISPSIKPLLPDGAHIDAETSALLLASKSNYERIIDGSASTLGVAFPPALSENLTSKRTSHKLAEQGRRNRINTALQEIAGLLPAGGAAKAESDADAAVAATNAASVAANSCSKAGTVELAIDYIKTLQSENEELLRKLREAERMLQEEQLGAMKAH